MIQRPAHHRPILLVEDNRNLALGMRVNLEDEGYVVHVAHTIADGMIKLRRTKPELVILDLSLPDGDGLDLLARMRASEDDTLVMVLSAKTQQDVKVRGLRGGADDYVTKPFDLAELLARVDGLLRRRVRDVAVAATASDPRVSGQRDASGEGTGVVTLGTVDIDVDAREVRRNGVALSVSRIAFDLLVALLSRRGHVVSRPELMRDVWGYGADVVSRTLDTHVFELRRLIEVDPGAPVHLKTVWGVGYRMD